MKKLFIRALKDLHKLESGPATDGMSVMSGDTLGRNELPGQICWPQGTSDSYHAGFFNSDAAHLTSSTVGLLSKDETKADVLRPTTTAQTVDRRAATEPFVDTVTPCQADTCDDSNPDGGNDSQRSSLRCGAIISRILANKRDTLKLEPGRDSEEQPLPLPRRQFASRIRSIPDDRDDIAQATDEEVDSEAEVENAESPCDREEEILDVNALLAASLGRIIIIPRSLTTTTGLASDADGKAQTVTVSDTTIEPFPDDTSKKYLAEDIAAASYNQAYPPFKDADAQEQPADNFALIPSPRQQRLVDAHKSSATHESDDQLPAAGEADREPAADFIAPNDSSDAGFSTFAATRAVNTTRVKLPSEATRTATQQLPAIIPQVTRPPTDEPTAEAPQHLESSEPTSLRVANITGQVGGSSPIVNSNKRPPPARLSVATAFEDEVRDQLRQSTNLAQFQELAGRLTKGFSRHFVGTIALAHLDEVQQALQVITSVARVMGMNKEVKTLLVDTDVNQKALSKCFDVHEQEGFGEALDRVQLCPHLVRPTATADVSILPAGNCVDPTGPGLDRVRRLISTLPSAEYPVVLIDAGELLNPLTKKVCKAVDSAHLLVRLGQTERAYAAQAIHMSGIGFAGCIVTNTPQIS